MGDALFDVVQAKALNAMLLESDNVHRPKIDMQQLQNEYGQDIVDFLLASTSTHRNNPQGGLSEILVSFC